MRSAALYRHHVEGGLARRGKAVLERRSRPRRLGAALKEIEGTVVSVQRNPDPAEARALEGAMGKTLHDLSGLNADLEDMLVVMQLADEYVGVSNTNVHLRAAAGRTARVLVPWPPSGAGRAISSARRGFQNFPYTAPTRAAAWSEALRKLASDLG